MGTNYYLERPVCPTCGRGEEQMHIGKSSAGWVFSLHVETTGDFPRDLAEWEVYFADSANLITDEYDRVHDREGLMAAITNRSRGELPGEEPFDYAANHAMPGPNGLVRSVIGDRCVGHGPGTWDLTTGDFT